jgi:molecular chaperone HscA
MSLYAIAEPHQQPASSGLAVGIDLGTTHSLAAIVNAEGVCEFLKDEQGHILLPSAVAFLEGDVVVGDVSLSEVLTSTKRLMGQSPESVSHLPFQFDVQVDNIPRLKTHHGVKTAIEVAAEILKVLWSRALQAYPEQHLKGAVITVPAYFDDAARKATADAAKLAQIPVLRLINEPTAAAYAYGYGQAHASTLMVFDFGGGTFDVSCLALEKGVFRVLATGGDLQCGGDNIDEAIYAAMMADARLAPSLPDQKSYRQQARWLKEQLSEKASATVMLEGQSFTLTREQLQDLAAPQITKMISICESVLRSANLSKADVSDLLMVGGSTRLAAVQTALTQWFGQSVKTDCNPDTIVARGAALQADRLAGNRRSVEDDLLVDVTPLSIGLEMMGGINEKIIARNTTIPCSVTQRFTTYQDGQNGMKLHIVQGEREMASDCLSLGACELTDIPPLPAGKAEVEVTFSLDADGLLTVAAQETHSNKRVQIELKPSYGLDDEMIIDLLESALSNADQDVKLKQWHLKAVEAKQLVQILKSTMDTDAHTYLSDKEVSALIDATTAVEKALLDQSSLGALSKAIESLEPLASHYIDCRLQAGLHHTLSGQTINKYTDT